MKIYTAKDLPVHYKGLHWTERKEVRELYIKLQEGMCYYCGKSLDEFPVRSKKITRELFPENFFKYPVHLHHSHTTGLTIGAVHAYCNAVLWEYYGE